MAPRRSLMLAAFAAANLLLVPPQAHAAFLPLPGSAAQVNDDPANFIDPAENAGVSDVVGGALTAGKVAVPWATFEQRSRDTQQIFVRAFKGGAWVTQGAGSLSIDTAGVAEGPSIDFAGPGRTVPWVAWYEPIAGLGWPTNIFASRFDATVGEWFPSGQSRGGLPSLNIHVRRTAENPSVAGGATVAGANPAPWVTWEENDGGPDDVTAQRQIFVAKAIKQAVPRTPCPDGTKPAGGNDVNGFCWQQVGLDRLDPDSPAPLDKGDPTLNIDPTRPGVEPDIAFTGPNDTVVWVVWYEEDPTGIDGLRSNQMVFAAKIVADAAADGGFHWLAVGNGTAGHPSVLDTSGAHGFGGCAESAAAEDACSLNAISGRDAENPRVAAGTLAPGGTTVPWVVWQEDLGGGSHGIFVSRLVGGDHFELFNGGAPLSNTVNDATRPDITFSGNVPYVSWQERMDDAQVTFVGHFEGGAASPTFVLDTPDGIPNSGFGGTENALRAPISSACTANPFNADGMSCQGGAVGTPFFLYTAGSDEPHQLLAQAFAPSDVSTASASDVTNGSATFNGSANPGGASVLVHFDFGPTAAHGTSSGDARLEAASDVVDFATAVSNLTTGDTVHFQAVAKTDFVSLEGGDRTFTVVNTPPSVSIDDLPNTVQVKELDKGRPLAVHLTVSEPADVTLALLKKNRVIRQVTVDQANGSVEAEISLKHIRGKLTLQATATDADGASAVVEQQFKAK